jgi:hypothetical protein
MPLPDKTKKKTSGEVIYDLVHLWTDITDAKKIRREVDRWTKGRHTQEEYVVSGQVK